MAAAIIADRISKRYRVPEAGRGGYQTLRDAIVQRVRRPFARQPMREFSALSEVSFEVHPGEVVGIIGRNGAGKSTLLKVLSRITKPSTGTIRLRGRVGSLLEVGTGFHPELTGRENIHLAGAVLGMRRGEVKAKFDAIVEFAEVAAFLDLPVKRYSSGMYTRLAFAVAAHLEPEILLVDEVLAVGDAAFQKKCLGKMDAVAGDGRTVLFVSHNMNAVETLCKSALLLHRGQVVERSANVRGVILKYLSGDGVAASGAEWKNAGDELVDVNFVPIVMRVVDAEGRLVDGPRRNDEPIFIHIEGEVLTTDPGLNVGFALTTSAGELLFWSLTTDLPEADWPKLPPGRVTLSVPLPTRFLNEGDYRAELIVSLHHRKWICEPGVNAPAVLFSVQGGLSDSPYWMARRPGLCAPVLPWRRI